MRFAYLLMSIVLASLQIQAKTYAGFPVDPEAGAMEITAPIQEIIEEGNGYSLQLVEHSGSYRFPKAKATNEVKKLFARSIRKKQKLHFKINAFAQEITEIDDVAKGAH